MATVNEQDDQAPSRDEAQALHPMAMRACEACKRKKTKCDMEKPACGLCTRTKRTCTYPAPNKLPRTSLKRTRSNSQPAQGSLVWLLDLLRNPTALQNLLTTQLERPVSSPDVLLPSDPVPDNFQQNGSSLLPPSLDGPALNLAFNTFSSENPSHNVILLSHPTEFPHISFDLAMDLIETFFDHIQPWLPLLHKPRFIARAHQELRQGSDALAGLSLEMAMLLTGMFGLSARFSTHPALADINPLERGSIYTTTAHSICSDLRHIESPDLLYLQGYIVLAFHAYTAELNTSAWLLTGVCVRISYDLQLAEIDSGEEGTPGSQEDVNETDVEEMRRAWWLTWELDTFGSLMTRKPFAVDRHAFTVKLPLSDNDWFAGRNVQSNVLQTVPREAWTSLQGSENQNPRAWFLIANHLLSLLMQHLSVKRPLEHEQLLDYETAFNCLKLSWPVAFDILRKPPLFEPDTFADYNWVFGTYLMLTTAYALLDTTVQDQGIFSNPLSSIIDGAETPRNTRAVSFSQVVARWPPEYMAAAHPFFVCNILPTVFETDGGRLGPKTKASFDAVGDTAELSIARFAQNWELAQEILTVFRVLRHPDTEAEADMPTLRRRFAAFLGRESTTGTHSAGDQMRPDLLAIHQPPDVIMADQNSRISFEITPSFQMLKMIPNNDSDRDSMFAFSDIFGQAQES
ncbi:hypothetical protein PV08_03683 [Exophiala spinifera]|uniref:Zn(2)-C6 fungal-type domain-containing protein n=1 Tax=Exophiala spinifera TaxID=91928 RepID=A0A0D2BKE0_9EURO|nr:uncharacterized protein PV08_03683 [Exophiala spinifera]KIW19388.1 hypothetical protein PV08_03683 [Exophiala spinifera]